MLVTQMLATAWIAPPLHTGLPPASSVAFPWRLNLGAKELTYSVSVPKEIGTRLAGKFVVKILKEG
jgi:hypothetical protein